MTAGPNIDSRRSDTANDVRSATNKHRNPPRNWLDSNFALALTSGIGLWVAFPPIGSRLLAWIAPLGWLVLIQRKSLVGRHPYLALWLAGFIHGLIVFQFIRLPHWAAYFGWIALAGYLAVYLALFVGLARVAVHRLRLSVIVAAPVVWVGLELARGHLISGFSMGLLGHSQVHVPMLIQISDVFGAYGVSFLVMFVAACLARMLPVSVPRWTWWPAGPMAIGLAATLVYGWYRLSEETVGVSDQRVARVALIQGAIDTVFDLTEEQAERRSAESFAQYQTLTVKARRSYPKLDLVVWPEGKFPVTDILVDADDSAASATNDQRLDPAAEQHREYFAATIQHAKGLSPNECIPDFYMLLGTQTVRFTALKRENFNSALFVTPNGEIRVRYFKMHRVPFGEYIPLGELFPSVYRLTPLPGALTPGKRPVVFTVAGLHLSPNICFESTVPHVIRRQIAALKDEGTPPDVLVNITDDGWFWGSSCLDHHLTCTLFRAVENRIPILVAANTGFSAWIDGNGMLQEQGPRRDTDVLYAEVRPDDRESLYQQVGDWPPAVCSTFCAVCVAVGLIGRFRSHMERRLARRAASSPAS